MINEITTPSARFATYFSNASRLELKNFQDLSAAWSNNAGLLAAFKDFGRYVPVLSADADPLQLATCDSIPADLSESRRRKDGTFNYNLGAHAITYGNYLFRLGESLQNIDAASLPQLNRQQTMPFFTIISDIRHVFTNTDLFADERGQPLQAVFDRLSDAPFHREAYVSLVALRTQAKIWQEQISKPWEIAFPAGAILEESVDSFPMLDGAPDKQIPSASVMLMPALERACSATSSLLGIHFPRLGRMDLTSVIGEHSNRAIQLDRLDVVTRGRLLNFVLQEALQDIPLPNGARATITEKLVGVANYQEECSIGRSGVSNPAPPAPGPVSQP